MIHFNIPDNVQNKLIALFDVANDAEVRLWQRYMTNSYELLKDTTQNLAEVGIYGGQVSDSYLITESTMYTCAVVICICTCNTVIWGKFDQYNISNKHFFVWKLEIWNFQTFGKIEIWNILATDCRCLKRGRSGSI